VIQRSIVLAQGNPITPDILTLIPGQFQTSIEGTMKKLLPAAPASQTGVVRPLDDVEKEAIEHAIHAKKGNMLQVAKALHISRTTLYAKIKKYQIDID
jgi:Response regulator containing CheY-like receiver, AAA-type ATPase, and DNA-binding domains